MSEQQVLGEEELCVGLQKKEEGEEEKEEKKREEEEKQEALLYMRLLYHQPTHLPTYIPGGRGLMVQTIMLAGLQTALQLTNSY